MTTKPQSDWDFSLTSYCECITVVDRNVGRTCDMLLTNRNDKGDGTSALSLCYTAEDSMLLAVLLSDLGVLWLWRSKLLWGGPRGQELHVGSPSELRATSTPHSVLPQVLNALTWAWKQIHGQCRLQRTELWPTMGCSLAGDTVKPQKLSCNESVLA